MWVAFDIETLGLLDETPLPEITCVCLCDDAERTYCFQIWQHTARAQNEAAVLALLDAADTICGFNAVFFDLEFIRRGFQTPVSDERMTAWVAKCLDPYMCALCLSETPCKMQRMLELNGMESKTGNGADAIRMAREGRWDELLSYCLMDAQLAMGLCRKEWIFLTDFLQVALHPSRPPHFRFSA